LKPHLITIIVTVIAGILVALFEYYFQYTNIYSNIWSGLRWVYCLLTIKIPLPIWLIIVILFTLPILTKIINYFRSSKSSPTYKDYTSDNFDGIQWFWDYLLNEIYEPGIHARCPSCSTLLDFRPTVKYIGRAGDGMIDVVELQCQGCGFSKVYDETANSLRKRIAKEIDRNIYSGEFMKRIGE